MKGLFRGSWFNASTKRPEAYSSYELSVFRVGIPNLTLMYVEDTLQGFEGALGCEGNAM